MMLLIHVSQMTLMFWIVLLEGKKNKVSNKWSTIVFLVYPKKTAKTKIITERKVDTCLKLQLGYEIEDSVLENKWLIKS